MAISGNTINNSGTGTIAARDKLLIGAQTLNNTNGGLIYSLGGITIGGAIVGGQVQGTMQTLTNASSRIEAGRDLRIEANTVNNRNDGLATAEVVLGTGYEEKVRVKNTGNQYSVGKNHCKGIGGGQKDNECVVYPDKYGKRSTLPPVFSTGVCTGGGDDVQTCTVSSNYEWNSPVFAQFQVATVGSPPPTSPLGGCTQYSGDNGPIDVMSPECMQWRGAMDAWNAANNERLAELDAKIAAYNAEVNHDNLVESFEHYTWYKVNSTTTRTEVMATAPGELLSGRHMAITGKLTNQDSRVVAGGTLSALPSANNIATQGNLHTAYSGKAKDTEIVHCGFSAHCRNWGDEYPYSPNPIDVEFSLPTVEYVDYAANPTITRNLATNKAAADASIAAAAMQAAGNTRPPVDMPPQSGTTVPVLSVPQNSLFQLNTAPAARYLVETDPRFISRTGFLSSDYYLQSLSRDPERELKRYGDGFVEQKLVNDQILALTGRRYLSGYASTEEEYRALMDAGVVYAKQYQLTPGVALTSEQMAQLSTDVVLLAAQTVTLPDGSTRQVLVPRVYLRRPARDDLQSSGALIAGSDVIIQTPDDLANSGTIAGDRVTLQAKGDLVNAKGRIAGQDLLVRANNDLKNLSGVIEGTGANSKVDLFAGRDVVLQTQTKAGTSTDGSGTGTTLQRIATVQGSSVSIAAGRDLLATGSKVKADGSLAATAERHIVADTAAAESRLHSNGSSGRSVQGRSGYIDEASTRHQGAAFESGGGTVLVAKGDARFTGTRIKGDDVTVQAQNITAGAAVNRTAADMQVIGEKSYNRFARDNETLVGTDIQGGNNVTLHATGNGQAGSGNLSITGSNINAEQSRAALIAANDVTINAGTTRQAAIEESYSKSSGLFSSTATTRATSTTLNQVQGSAVSGNTVVVQAGRDIKVAGSGIAGEGDVVLSAWRDAVVAAATATRTDKRFEKVEESGFLSGGGFGINYGNRTTTNTADTDGTTQSGQTRSLVGSKSGDLTIRAGRTVQVTGTDLVAGGDMLLDGQRIITDPGQDRQQGRTTTKMQQDALTLGLTGSAVSAVQSTATVADAAGKTSNVRVQALAAGTAGLTGANAAKDIAQGGPSIGVALTLGHSESESARTTANQSNTGTTLTAGRDLTLRATGAGRDSNILAAGSDVRAGNNIHLKADNRIELASAQDTQSQHSSSKSSSVGVGVAATVGSKGMAVGVTANASLGRAHEDGEGTTQVNAHVAAGNQLRIDSGGDTHLKGAVVSGRQIVGDIGGDLVVESRQDTARFDSKSQTLGGSVTAGFGVSGSVSVSQSNIKNDYASVGEQTAMRAGDGGFQLNVKGNTDLRGGVISSTQAAIDNKQNTLKTATLTPSDVENHANYSGNSISLSSGISVAGGSGQPSENGQGKGPGGVDLIDAGKLNGGRSGANAPIAMDASGDNRSVTRSGISGATIVITDEEAQKRQTGQDAATTVAMLNRDVLTGKDTSGKLANDFNKQEIDAAFTVTGEFGRQVGTFVANKASEADALREAAKDPKLSDEQRTQLIAQANQIEADWGPGCKSRQWATAITAAASGNVTGASGETVNGAVVNYLQQQGAGYIGQLVQDNKLKEGSPEHAAMHAIVACAGAAAGNQSCGAGAMGAASSSLLTNLFKEKDNETNAERESKRNLIVTIVTGVAATASPAAAATATSATIAATDNNYLTQNEASKTRKQLLGCKGEAACVKRVSDEALALSLKNSEKMKQACDNDFRRCMDAYREAKGGYNTVEPISIQTIAPELGDKLLAIQQSDMAYARQRAEVLARAMPSGMDKTLAMADLYAPDLGSAALGSKRVGTASRSSTRSGAMDSAEKTGSQQTSFSSQPIGANKTVTYPEGLAYRKDLPDHLFGPDGFTKSGQLSGTHNLSNATAALDSVGATYKLNPTSTPGILELSYNYTNPVNGKPVIGSKTVYDPALYSDKIILDLSQKAGKVGFENYLQNSTQRIFDVNQDGINFRTYINIDPKTGMPFVGNVHPIK
ncbi:hemagglutinin repeat-containing protein [Noviherbaspirillum humi]|uniref:hemagglutinin repeat-containing protein n=1 Tax=Noviherbaspirillum humi TaxID=1688639 RepID=UPI001C3C385E|nr:hemagglutinin repeat-containing protein [Noviherbaspirillum humi]